MKLQDRQEDIVGFLTSLVYKCLKTNGFLKQSTAFPILFEIQRAIGFYEREMQSSPKEYTSN